MTSGRSAPSCGRSRCSLCEQGGHVCALAYAVPHAVGIDPWPPDPECVRTEVSTRAPGGTRAQPLRSRPKSLDRETVPWAPVIGRMLPEWIEEPRRGCCAPNPHRRAMGKSPDRSRRQDRALGLRSDGDPGGCNSCTCPRTQAFCHHFVLVMEGGIPELWCSAA